MGNLFGDARNNVADVVKITRCSCDYITRAVAIKKLGILGYKLGEKASLNGDKNLLRTNFKKRDHHELYGGTQKSNRNNSDDDFYKKSRRAVAVPYLVDNDLC